MIPLQSVVSSLDAQGLVPGRRFLLHFLVSERETTGIIVDFYWELHGQTKCTVHTCLQKELPRLFTHAARTFYYNHLICTFHPHLLAK